MNTFQPSEKEIEFILKLFDKSTYMKILNYREINKGAMKASMTVELTELGMAINQIVLFEKAGKQWLSFPSRKRETSDGVTKYSPYVFMIKEKKEKFDAAVLMKIQKGEYEVSAKQQEEEELF